MAFESTWQLCCQVVRVPATTAARAFSAACLAWLTSGCAATPERGHALHTAIDPPPERDEVARLIGAVQYVDGRNVSSFGNTFELLPGCHVVVTPRNWGRTEGAFVATVIPTGRRSFAIPMRAGYEYVVDVEMTDRSDPQGAAEYVAYERAPDGNTSLRFAPARSEKEVVDCLAEGMGGPPVSGAPQR